MNINQPIKVCRPLTPGKPAELGEYRINGQDERYEMDHRSSPFVNENRVKHKKGHNVCHTRYEM